MLDSTISLFRGLDRVRIVEIEALLRSFHAEPGELVYRDGESPAGLYFVESGYVEIHHSSLEREDTHELRLVRGPGDYFGELTLIDRRRRHATVTAIEKVRGHFLPQDAFERFIMREPLFLINLTRDLLARTTQHDSELIRELVRTKISAERFIDRLKALTHTSQVINSTLDLDKLLDLILREGVRHTGADKGTIYVVDEETDELYSRVLDGDMVHEIRLAKGVGIAGHVAATGDVLNIPDAYEDPRFNPEIDRESGYRTRSMLTMPMRDPDRRIVGVIQLLNKEGEFPFNHDDERFIDAMGVQASIAIDKARLAEQMVRNESLAAVGKLASTIIHDFKNPMTIIRGYAQLLEMSGTDEEKKSYLDVITSQIDRLVGMTQEVLDFARGDTTMNFDTMPLGSFFQDLCNTIERDTQEHDITLTREIEGEDVDAVFDPGRLTRVFFNLTGNARDAMEEGGTLTVKVWTGENSWHLAVQDTGKGIPEEYIGDIFNPFATFEKEHGTGLGLAISRNVVEQHGGTIEVESEPGQGTTFTLTFPLVPKTAEVTD